MRIMQNIKIYDGIFIFAVIFFFVVTSVVNIICGKDFSKQSGNISNDYIHIEARYRKKIWIKSSITWLAIHYFIVLSTFLSTSIVIYISSLPVNNGNAKILFYSIVSFFSSIISYVVNPYKTSLAYRKAYMIIDSALLKDKNIKDAIREGETIIYKGHK